MKSVLYRNQGLEVLRNPFGFWSYIYLKTVALFQVSLWSNVSFFLPLFLPFFFQFLLKYSWYTVLCQFLVCIKVNQLHIYIYIYIYIYINSFLYSFSIWAFTEYWVEFLVLYSRSLLFIYFTHSSVYVSIPISEPNVCFFGTYACVKLLGSERNRLNFGFLPHWRWKVSAWNLNILLHLDCQVDLQRTFQEKQKHGKQ